MGSRPNERYGQGATGGRRCWELSTLIVGLALVCSSIVRIVRTEQTVCALVSPPRVRWGRIVLKSSGRLLVVGLPPMIAQGFVRLLQQAGVTAAYAALPLSSAGSGDGDEHVGILALVGHNELRASSLLMQVRESLPDVTLYLLGAAQTPWLEAVSAQFGAINLSESTRQWK